MDGSDDFDVDWPELDASTLQEVERLENAAKTNPTLARTGSLPAVTRPLGIVNNGATTVGAGFSRDNRLNFQQKDLFGNTVAHQQASTSRGVLGAASTSANANPVNAVVRKQWDRTAYAKSGVIRSKGKGKTKGKPAKGKGKGTSRQYDNDDEDDEDDEEEDEEPDPDDPLFDPEEARRPPKPMKLEADREACKTFVYPLNKPLRKYQYDIIAKAFFTDTLVALPTGLGKTFLAAVLMYNYYRWFPKGKIIFMAPSRPLVTQQISACHGIVGIPLKDAVEMTGKDLPERRAEAWRKRRVFYCTPQTVQNDLFKQRLDPSEVVCMVIDEAHKATGDYAYCKVIRYMMQKNPHFRVLALTATPGGNAEVVQSVLDALHIGHIEVRSDESFDTRQYIHNKRVDLVKIPIEGELESIRERYGNLMKILLDQVRDIVKTSKTDPTTMHPYLFQASMKLVGQSGKKWAYTTLTFLGAMARGIAKLLEQSVTAFFEDLKALRKSAKGKAAEVINHRDFATIYRDTEDLVSGKGFAGHPKMVKLSELVLEHFEASRKEGTLESTRIMVFCTFREVVEEIVQRLNGFDGIRATRLVGQGTDTKGKKGLDQKQQNKTLSSFKKGEFNVLVATSIGEEGLDIGELDLIICYDAAKSPIRTLQRAGRTGRARQGRVIVLMTEGMEDDNWKKANEKYKEVQNAILSGKQFELYADCQRLVPADIRPVADKKELVIEPFEPEQLGLGRKIAPTGKRKRDENDNLDLFETGFQKASGRKTGAQQPRNLSVAQKSKGGPESYIPEGDPYLAPEEANDVKKRTVKPTVPVQDFTSLQHTTFPKKLPLELPSSRRFVGTSSRTNTLWTALRAGQELSADRNKHAAWERATYDAFKPSNVNWWESATSGKDRGFQMLRKPNSASKNGISHLPPGHTNGRHSTVNSGHANVHNNLPKQHDALDEMSDDDLPDISGLSGSKLAKQSESIVMLAGDKNKNPSKGSSLAVTYGACPQDRSIITIDDSDDEQQGQVVTERRPPTVLPKNDRPEASGPAPEITSVDGSDLYFDDLDMSDIVAIEKPTADPRRVFGGADERSRPISPALASITNKLSGKPSVRSSAKHSDDESPILAPKKRVKRVAVVTSSPDKASAQTVAAAAQNLATTEETMDQCEPSELSKKQVRGRLRPAGHAERSKGLRRRRLVDPGLAAYLDTVAVNSDNEDSASCTSEEIAAETTSDRVFLDSEDVANPGDMSKFYRESLMSQAAHKFGNEAVRPGVYKMKRLLHEKGRPIVEDPEDESQEGRVPEQSQYERGSFCVDDDEELEYSQRDDEYLDDSE